LAGIFGVPAAGAQNFGSVSLGSSQSQSVTVRIGTAGTVGNIKATAVSLRSGRSTRCEFGGQERRLQSHTSFRAALD
jgi:hypothetical protein